MLLSSPHLDQKVSQEPVDADALDTLLESAGWSERMPYTACTSSFQVEIAFMQQMPSLCV